MEQNHDLATSLESLITSSIRGKLSSVQGHSYAVCIYKVSEKHRKANQEAYTPRLVSIGPIHHGKSQLQAMEVYKLRCLNNFLTSFGISLDSLVKFVTRQLKEVRGCYEDTIQLSSQVFSEIILLDGIFIVDLFLKNHSHQMRVHGDIIFENRWMSNDLLHDMLLLENQLPLTVPLGLFNLIYGSYVREISFYGLAREYFKNVGYTGKSMMTKDCYNARHLVELLIYLHKPSGPRQVKPHGKRFEYMRCAAELQEAGVKFSSVDSTSLFEVNFTGGTLTIPKFVVNDSTETFFRNLIAFEQCGYYDKYITSYVILMDILIDTRKDVELLVEHGILQNDLGESQQVADLFNSLYSEIINDANDFYFADICEVLHNYSKDPWHKWKSTWFKWNVILKRDYFSNPWSGISLAVALLILISTVIQTVCTVIQTKKG